MAAVAAASEVKELHPDQVTVKINGKFCLVPKDITIKRAAELNSITIPRSGFDHSPISRCPLIWLVLLAGTCFVLLFLFSLCYHPRLSPAGRCKICVVEVVGEYAAIFFAW